MEINKDEQSVVTKGDANESNDGSPIPYNNIIGKAHFCVPYLGFISMNIKTPKGIIGICGLLVVIILLTFIPEIFSNDEEEDGKEKAKKAKKSKGE